MNKLKYRNNWGNIIFYTELGDLKEVKKVSIGDHCYDTKKSVKIISVFDHGHNYDVRQEDYAVDLRVDGLNKTIKKSIKEMIDQGFDVFV